MKYHFLSVTALALFITFYSCKKDDQSADVTDTFGLNAAGNATSCPGTNPFYYRLEWTGAGGNNHYIILPY